jgi:enterochelin esterase-like enzyme
MHALATLAAALVLPGFLPTATEPEGGQLLTGTFPGTARSGYVYLPPGFNLSHRYPVVYLLHGLPGSPSEYIDGAGLGEFADAQIVAGTLRPFIAVIPAAGTSPSYNGEWAGYWETALVNDIVPWVDAHLPTLASASGRTIAGLSAGGFGAVDIALRHPGLFGTVESWSGYFTPLRDGPFVDADMATLEAHNPTVLVRGEAATLRRDRTRFAISTGPAHSRQVKPASSTAFADELRTLRIAVAYHSYASPLGQWREQLDNGLVWALGRG